MNYHLKSSRPQGLRKKLVIYAGIAIGVAFFVLPGVFFIIGAATLGSIESIKQTIVSGYTVTASYVTSHQSLSLENAALKKQLADLEGFRVQNTVLESELSNIKDIQKNEDELLVDIIATPPQVPYGMIVVSGARNASVDALVISSGDVLVGKVGEVFGNYARVHTLSAGGSEISVENHRTHERYIISGQGAGNYTFDVPKDSDIQTGDVLVHRLDSVYIVAVVEQIETRDSSPFLTAYAKIPVSIYGLAHLTIKPFSYEPENL